MSVSKASFRGVPFGVESAGLDGGRRVSVHEMPMRDVPFVEDLGMKSRTFTVEGFVVGDDWRAKRDKLLEALEKSGAGELVHPFMGTMTVQVMTYTVTEGRDKLRTAIFSMQFSQSQAVTYPVQASDSGTMVRNASMDAQVAVAEAASRKVVVQNSTVAASAENTIKDATKAIDKDMSSEMVKASKRGENLLDVADRYTRDLAKLTANAASLGRKPLEYAYRVQGIVSRLGSISAVIGTIEAYIRLAGSIKRMIDNTKYLDTLNGRIEKENAKALLAPVTVACLTSAAEVATVVPYESRQQAESVRGSLFDIADQIMADTDDDDLYQAIYRLKLSMAEVVPPQGYRLKDVVTVPVNQSLPAVVLAYQLYGDASKDLDIVARNGVVHPGQVPGGSSIEVIL